MESIMKNLVVKLGAAAIAATVMATGAWAASAYPKNKPREQDWSFAGPFGMYDQAQLQRGLKIYAENCSACHALSRVNFRNLADLGYSDEQIKAFAANYEVEDGPDDFGDMFFRPATAADAFPSPFPNQEAARAANGGAYPPDLSLIAKARAPIRGFPAFVIDPFRNYAENGPDYIYSLLTGYKDEVPEDVSVPEGLWYNPYFASGTALAMAPPLFEGMHEFDDGTEATVSNMAKDVAAFLMWTAEPHMDERKQLGFRVMVFLLIFAALLYLSKKQVWARVEH
ncbi:MAG: cytochrome c1 [Roseitalea sp.]|nr:cytochrome c1 [Roseitalea sp.]MBO6952014.1 cytochrome c1 [Rhizobiaceae bacterium]MBO6592140.1 cytochrome c1 [Roseitalea sp.]MBO6598395.1 cytochrome c1 [Roseitalea sp.]MBO6610841.1 cytochrome c1 [Roseitalea sp.]